MFTFWASCHPENIMYFSYSLLIIFIRIFSVNSSEDYCSINKEQSCSQEEVPEQQLTVSDSHKFEIRYQKYYEAIEKAEEQYEQCEAKNCSSYKYAITRDLRFFKIKGIDEKLIELSRSRGTIYQIINGSLYRSNECMFPSRCAGIEHFIFKVIDKIPDTEFIVNTRDYPQSSKHFGEALPIFSFSKTQDYFDIMYPAWSFWEGGPAISLYPRGLGRWDKHRISLNDSSHHHPWDTKENKAFFRGSRTSPERDNLVLLSRKNPDLVDAQYTKNQAWKSDQDTLGQSPASEVSLEEHCKYKYLFNYRGVAASFRHKHLFLCNSLVFHVGDEWLEFYYDAMKPWIHYIPVNKDATQNELEEIISFANHNQIISRKIAERGRDFIWHRLRMSDVTSYWKKLLQKYSKLLTFKPSRKDDMHQLKKS